MGEALPCDRTWRPYRPAALSKPPESGTRVSGPSLATWNLAHLHEVCGAAAPQTPRLILGGGNPQTPRLDGFRPAASRQNAGGLGGSPRPGVWEAGAPQDKAGCLGGGAPPDFMYMCKIPGPYSRLRMFLAFQRGRFGIYTRTGRFRRGLARAPSGCPGNHVDCSFWNDLFR